MHGVKRGVVVLAVLVVVGVVLAFVLENQQGVFLSFLGMATAQIPVSVFVIGALLIGMLIGPLLGVLVGRPRSKPYVSKQS